MDHVGCGGSGPVMEFTISIWVRQPIVIWATPNGSCLEDNVSRLIVSYHEFGEIDCWEQSSWAGKWDPERELSYFMAP